MEELLARFNIKKEDLNIEEARTLKNWAEQLQNKTLSLKDVRDYIEQMISAVEREVAGYEYPKGFSHWLFRRSRMRHMKARLYNYIMLRDFLMAPEKARSFIEKQISNFNPKKIHEGK